MQIAIYKTSKAVCNLRWKDIGQDKTIGQIYAFRQHQALLQGWNVTNCRIIITHEPNNHKYVRNIPG